MRGIHQCLEILGSSIGAFGSEQRHAVIAPIPFAGKFGYRHQFDGRHPKCDKMIELLNGGEKRALRRKGADMELVDNGFFPRSSGPPIAFPAVSAWVDDLARPMDVIGLESRDRIGHVLTTGQDVAIKAARAHAINELAMPAIVQRRELHGCRIPSEQNRDRLHVRGPQPKLHTFFVENGSKTHIVRPPPHFCALGSDCRRVLVSFQSHCHRARPSLGGGRPQPSSNRARMLFALPAARKVLELRTRCYMRCSLTCWKEREIFVTIHIPLVCTKLGSSCAAETAGMALFQKF